MRFSPEAQSAYRIQYYYPGHWIHCEPTPHWVYHLHSPGSIPCRAAISSALSKVIHIKIRLSHATRSPFHSWVQSSKCGLNALPKDISATIGDRTRFKSH